MNFFKAVPPPSSISYPMICKECSVAAACWMLEPVIPLEGSAEPQAEAARRTDGVPGEQPAKINHIQNVGEILSVNLEMHLHPVRLIYIRARRRIHLKRRQNAAAVEVQAIKH